MSEKQKDHWSSEAYQNSASFVPKLATQIVQWLDPKPDDVILDIGCGDGVLNIQFAEILSQGQGKIHGTDSSPAMVQAADKNAQKVGADRCMFEVIDAHDIANHPNIPKSSYTKAFSNAALHWILRCPVPRRESFFAAIRDTLVPGGTFAFEMGGLGCVAEMRAGILSAVSRRVGLKRALAAEPWFFPDETWAREILESRVGGWKVEKVERVWRPTEADAGGVEGWVRLMGPKFFEVVEDEAEREECIKEAVEVLQEVCKNMSGGHTFNYVRLRVLARKL